MAGYNDILRTLASEGTPDNPLTTADLATKVSSTQDSIRSLCSQLKKKGYVDGSTREGWVITNEGREALERQEKIPISPEDVGADTKSKFEYYGKLAGVPPDLILAVSEMVMAGDPEDLDQVWEKMTLMDVPITNRRRWFNSFRYYLKQPIPPHLAETVTGSAEAKAEAEAVSARDKGRDYIILDDEPVFVGYGVGDYSLKDAKDIVGMRMLRYRFQHPQAGVGGAAQPFGLADIITIIDKINEGRGQAASPKAYVVTHGPEGTKVQEFEGNQPIVVSPPAQSQGAVTYYLDEHNQLKQAQAGQPIILRQQPPAAQQTKTYIVRQTEKGVVAEEHDIGKPIIINTGPPASGMSAIMPWPAMGADGKPILDKDGNPVYVNLEPMMKYVGFQKEEQRKDERHSALMGIAQTVRENFADGIQALVAAAQEYKEKGTSKEASSGQPQVYECGNCHTQFQIPNVPFETVKCPNPVCGRAYTKEEVLSV